MLFICQYLLFRNANLTFSFSRCELNMLGFHRRSDCACDEFPLHDHFTQHVRRHYRNPHLQNHGADFGHQRPARRRRAFGTHFWGHDRRYGAEKSHQGEPTVWDHAFIDAFEDTYGRGGCFFYAGTFEVRLDPQDSRINIRFELPSTFVVFYREQNGRNACRLLRQI